MTPQKNIKLILYLWEISLNYFDRGVNRISGTARIPESVDKDLVKLRDLIREETNIKVSKNDLVTIGAIIISQIDRENLQELKEVGSYNELLTELKKNIK